MVLLSSRNQSRDSNPIPGTITGLTNHHKSIIGNYSLRELLDAVLHSGGNSPDGVGSRVTQIVVILFLFQLVELEKSTNVKVVLKNFITQSVFIKLAFAQAAQLSIYFFEEKQ